MPVLVEFTDNSFRTRADCVRAVAALIRNLDRYKSPNKARLKIATDTGAGFDEISAQLEGFARPLWAVSNMVHLGASDSFQATDLNLDTWIQGLRAGTDPRSAEYWGDISDYDQRMVEMESIAYALLLRPELFSFAQDPTARSNLIVWLRQINNHKMPQSNWLWFRVLVNLAMVKTLGVPLSELKNHIDASFEQLDDYYISHGWSSDGLWCDERKQMDYYSGSFAIQFAQLIYIQLAPDYDFQRAERYKQQAREFAKSYWRYFAPDGAAIPFGRSLTYRFAFAAFWAAASTAGIHLPAPVNKVGTIKGLLLRHLRWWAQKPSILNVDGTLNIGYTYPNMYLAENYNSPQSVYWCLKSLIVIGLEETHPFWTAEELEHPQIAESSKIEEVELLWPPRHILCNTSVHHFLLSSGQSTTKHFKAREAKYGKFAYSSHFGFSVPCGVFIEQIAPDSTLAVAFEEEKESWKVRWDPRNVRTGTGSVANESVLTLTSCWKPWAKVAFEITTTLVAPSKKWPGWHLRVHQLHWKQVNCATTRVHQSLHVVDGGFATSAQTGKGYNLPEQTRGNDLHIPDVEPTSQFGWWCDHDRCLILSEAGASGIIDLTEVAISSEAQVKTTCELVQADPNTNIMFQRSLIPTIQHRIPYQTQSHRTDPQTFVTGVFAVEPAANLSRKEILRLWENYPKGQLTFPNNNEQSHTRLL